MLSFSELESQFNGIPVHVVDDENISGFLHLNGSDTRAILSSSNPFKFRRGKNGWFDLDLRASGGKRIVLHNAVSMKETEYRLGSTKDYQVNIFPNIVLIGQSVNLNQISAISFGLHDFVKFFDYDYTENHSIDKADSEIIAKIRESSEKRSSIRPLPAYDFFRPDQVYVVHRLPRILKFRLEKRHYEIGVRQSWGGTHRGNINFRTEPFARISFAPNVTIDTALEYIWEWNQFFAQIACRPVALKSIFAEDENIHDSVPINIYLSYLAQSTNRERNHRPNTGEIPFNHWRDRHILRDAMRGWLKNSNLRRLFRSALSRSILESPQPSALDTLLRLCSGLENLCELSGSEKIDSRTITRMANAAAAVQHDDVGKVDVSRIKNLLSAINRPSLKHRLNILGEQISIVLPHEITMPIISEAVRLRNLAAHGGSLTERELPMAHSVVEGLSSMCVIFDLLSSGLPLEDSEHRRLLAIGRVLGVADELNALREK